MEEHDLAILHPRRAARAGGEAGVIALALMLAQATNPFARYAKPYSGPANSFSVFGVGNLSCATAWTPDIEVLTTSWITGFWTGVNAGRAAQVGKDTDGNGVIGEVKKLCETHPSLKLTDAAMQAYIAMANR